AYRPSASTRNPSGLTFPLKLTPPFDIRLAPPGRLHLDPVALRSGSVRHGSLLRDDAFEAHAIRCLEERGAIGERFGTAHPGIVSLEPEPFKPLLAIYERKRAQILAIEVEKIKRPDAAPVIT